MKTFSNLISTITLTLFFSYSSYTQNSLEKDSIVSVKKTRPKVSSFIGFHPSKTTLTNGLYLKYFENGAHNYTYKVNGVLLDINPIGLFMPFLTVIHAYDIFDVGFTSEYTATNFNIINGVNFSLFNSEKTKVNGLDINLSIGFEPMVNGISIGLVHRHHKINGISFGALFNKSKRCKGIQIGLVNECHNLKGIQIGLWNINQNKNLPIINWSF